MNKNQRDFLLSNAKPGDIIYITGKSWITNVIAFGQGEIDKTWTKKLGHAVFVNAYMDVVESSITIESGKYVSGIHVTPIEKWEANGQEEEYLIIQRLNGLSVDELKDITSNGLELKNRRDKYPIGELFGTLIAYANYNFAGLFKGIMGKDKVDTWQSQILRKNNPLDQKNARYCIATVNYCYENAGLRIIPTGVSESLCAVGDGLRNKDRDYTLLVPEKENPTKFFTYVKPHGWAFDPTLGCGFSG